MSRASIGLAMLGAAFLAAACGGAVPAPQPSPTPGGTPAQTPGASPVVTPPATPDATPATTPGTTPGGVEGVVVTFRVVEEEYRVLVTDPDQIGHVRELLEGKQEGRIPNGLIVYGESDVNEGWSWHIDPESLEFADMTAEVCDGLPSHVEDRTVTSDRYCPWSAEVIDIQPAP
jgi:hypothetical protein